jgi:ankyrin repeat protein
MNNNNNDLINSLLKAQTTLNRDLLKASENITNTGVVRYLLDNGADVHVLDKDGNTALHLAALSNENPEVLEVLLKAGAKVDAKNNDGTTPAYNAIYNKFNNDKMLEVLLKHGANPNDTDKSTITLCHYAVEKETMLKCLELLIKYGANINTNSYLFGTPCHRAVYSSNFNALSLLLSAGADLSILDQIGCSAYDVSKRLDTEVLFNQSCLKAVIEDAGFNAIRERIKQICVDLQDLGLDDDQMCELVIHECKPFTEHLERRNLLNFVVNIRNAMKKA